MININNGLKHSFEILKCLKKDKDLKNININVECFFNCREMGLTFSIYNGKKYKTFCIYEHRNSDNIIINSKEEWSGIGGELPYKADNKFIYDAEFVYNEDKKAAIKLKELMIEFLNSEGGKIK